ncbi:chromosome transmission fidelity protein 8 [Cercophora newfieldiana]|uniref:Chromosome transmission fidelity protein 8 n=1 Tax=Cercophora newfieldiana TaxID=92897 RepID=A0AA40CU13_9PEZI|nr:chromosome transmission fidelity protein 8 [Cercophora newfieldiana]
MSTTITLHPRQPLPPTPKTNPLPPLLQTPFGLVLLELQGTINFPSPSDADPDSPTDETHQPKIPPNQIGHLTFPEYNPDALDPTSTAWMRRVYMYVGEHQRLMGEVKKLGKPVAVVRGRGKGAGMGSEEEEGVEELEVVDLVRYKIVFAQRPEPVTAVGGGN